MAIKSQIPKPFIAALLAGAAYVGVKHLMLRSQHTPAVAPQDRSDTAPVATNVPAVKTSSASTVKNTTTGFPLQVGSTGNNVKTLQRALGVDDDGIFGKNTLAALKVKYNIVSVSKEYFQSIIKGNIQVQALQAARPQKGQLVTCTTPYKLPVIGVTVPAGFLLGYATGRFKTENDLVAVQSIEVTCTIDGTNGHCPENLKQYHKRRFTYWVVGKLYRLFSTVQSAMAVYPNISVSITAWWMKRTAARMSLPR